MIVLLHINSHDEALLLGHSMAVPDYIFMYYYYNMTVDWCSLTVFCVYLLCKMPSLIWLYTRPLSAPKPSFFIVPSIQHWIFCRCFWSPEVTHRHFAREKPITLSYQPGLLSVQAWQKEQSQRWKIIWTSFWKWQRKTIQATTPVLMSPLKMVSQSTSQPNATKFFTHIRCHHWKEYLNKAKNCMY